MDHPLAAPPSRIADCANDYARREPSKAVAAAFGLGMCLTMLPIGAIAAAAVGIAFTLVRPLLLFLGLVKACELCGKGTSSVNSLSHE